MIRHDQAARRRAPDDETTFETYVSLGDNE